MGVLYPYRHTNVVKFCMNEWTFRPRLHAKFHTHQRNVSLSPLQCEQPQNRPQSNLNTGTLALCATRYMLLAYKFDVFRCLTGHSAKDILILLPY